MSSSSTCTDTDARRATLDQRILALQLQLSDLRSERNTLAPISSLSADVLLYIFRSTTFGLGIEVDNIYNACVVSWVCRLWRNIAIQSQGMWGTINCRSPQLVRLCLERAPSIPLRFILPHFDLSPEPTAAQVDLLSTVMSQLGRTATLILGGGLRVASRGAPSSAGPIVDFSLNPAPILETLWLEKIELPAGTQMFAGIPPPLCTLSLSHCKFTWDTQIFRTSRDLIQLTISSPIPVMSLGGFQGVLRHMPRLQSLYLKNAFEDFSRLIAPFPTAAVHMPDLKHLDVENCSTQLCSVLLSGLTFTNKTVLMLQLYDETFGGGPGLANILQALNGCTADSPWDIDTISLDHGESSYIRLLSERHSNWTTSKVALVQISIGPCLMDAAQMLHAFASFDCDNIETVILNATSLDITVPDDIWQQAFGGLPSLTKLKVRHGYANSFIDYLAREGRHIAELTSASAVPSLTQEHAREYVTFKSLKLLEIFRFSEHRVQSNFADLVLAMTLRKQCGVDLVGMAFASCHFHEFNVLELSGVVRGVHVCSERELVGGEDGFIMASEP